MMRISRMRQAPWLLALLLAAMPAASDTAVGRPILESTSSGLITFSGDDQAIRVAAVLAQRDAAVIPTLVRFLDASGTVLKQQRGDLSDGRAVVAELTRADVAGRELLVRVEVFHKLPRVRERRYPILVTTQPISLNGSGHFAVEWNAGSCGCPTCGPTIPSGEHVDCEPTSPGDI